jgi:putative hemolysin
VIDITQLFFALLVLLLALDLLTFAARSCLSSVNLPRLVAFRDQEGVHGERVSEIIHTHQHLRAGLNFFQVMLRFALAGTLLVLLGPEDWALSSKLVVGGALLLSALLIFWVEELIDGRVSRSAEYWALRMYPYARFIKTIFSPFLALPLAFQRANGVEQDLTTVVTADELKSLVDAGHQEGFLEQDEREMIYSIFQLGDTLAREIMVPRIYVTALDISLPLPEAVDAFLKSGYSRVPIYEETIDNILGLLYAKDLLKVWREGEQAKDLRDMLRPAYFVPEAKKVDELLDELQARQVHMAIVVDEYGGVAGLVTLEDIVEEIVGEIRDEYDLAEELPYQLAKDGSYIFLGRVDLDDFNEVMGTHLPREEAETIGGFMYSRIGRVPKSGEFVRVDDLLLVVEQVSGRRIRKVRAQIQPLPLESKEEDVHDNQ